MDPNESGEVSVTRFGNFEVLTNPEGGLFLLGGGGFGKTYKARHVYLNQIVALKVINDRFLHDNAAKERFLREAQVVNQLRHPHIAHVIDFGEVKHSLYYAMEFCGGGNLEHMVSRVGPLPLPIALRCARQLAEALGCAHSHGFIHRDVKPANIMLTGSDDQNPQLKLVDFGLVKHLQGGGGEATAALTMTGQQFFTIQFASPEQLMEEELDARSDIFALGMTVWFLLKGSAPEGGSMASIVAKRLDGRSYEPLLPTNLPPAYRAVLARLLEKDRTLRFQNTDEVLAALDAAEAAPDASPETDRAQAGEPGSDSGPVTGPVAITERYTVLENIGVMPLGVLYRATSNRDNEQVAITMIGETLCEDPVQRGAIERNVALLREKPHETIAQVYGLEEYQEGLALVQEWHRGVSLQSILRSARFLTYSDALRVLLPIAQGTDWTVGQGLPGIVLEMDEIYLQPLDAEAYPDLDKLRDTPIKSWPPFRVRLLPFVIREDASEDVGRTINTEIVSAPTVAFACVLYHLVAGHAPRVAARMSRQAYVTIGRFAEDSNRLLASCIANEQDFGGCEGILRALNTNEGIGFPPPPPKPPTTEVRTGQTGLPPTGSNSGGVKTGLPPTGQGRMDTGSGRGGGLTVMKDGARGDTRTGGGLRISRSPADIAREAEEIRVREEAEAARLRQQQLDEERARDEAAAARARQQQAEEERARRAAEENRLKQLQADAVRAKKLADEERARQAAEERRLKQQQAEEERVRKDAEAKQLKQQQADAVRAKKLADEERAREEAENRRLKQQQAEEERVRRDAEAKQLKQQQADAVRAKKLADEERVRQAAEERRLKQQQADAARSNKLAVHPLKQAALPEAKQAVPEVATLEGGARRQPSGLPLAVWIGALAACLAVLAVIAFFVLHKTTPPATDGTTPPVVVDSPTPSPTPSVAPPTPPALPGQFVFTQGFNLDPTKISVKINDQTVKTTSQGATVMVPLSGASAGDTLSVGARGYESQTFPVTQDATVNQRVELHRQQGEIAFQLVDGTSDYATAVFRPLQALPGEGSVVRMEPDERSLSLAADAQGSLPTGSYQITLLGKASDSKVQPRLLEPRFPVAAQRNVVTIPPSLAGRYNFSFMFKQDLDHAPMQIRRTVVIDPGLKSGHVDDIETEGKAMTKGTMITDLVLDSRGKLHGIMRFSLRRDDQGYDEQFELSYADNHFVIVSGGWEIQPTDPEVAQVLKNKFPGYQFHLDRPDPRTVMKE